MTPERYQRIGQLFDEALELTPEQRPKFLAQACSADMALRTEVEKLLANHIKSAEFLSRPAIGVAATLLVQNQPVPAGASASGKQISYYKILSVLGSGGMGEVYLVEDTRLHRKVALKVLPQTIAVDSDRLRRFEQEAFAASALNHPNILTIFEFGAASTDGGETHFLATEFVQGETLRDRIQRGHLTLSETFDITTQIASALHAAHEAGIIHRDIKPENVMIRNDGIVKVLDFGLAKLLAPPATVRESNSDSEAKTRRLGLTQAGMIMGTIAYMSPEQARGVKIDSRTDIFSLGVVLYEMLAGQRPFTGDSDIDVLSAILREEPPELQELNPKISPALQKIVRKCLDKNPERRFHSAHDLGFALEAVSTSSTPSGSRLDTELEVPVTLPTKRTKTLNRERLAWLFALGFAVLALTGLFYAWQARSTQNPQRTFRQLSFRREAIFQAGFAPDGKTVVYSGATDGNTPEIFTLHPDSPAPQPVGMRGMHLLDISSKGELAILTNAQWLRHRTFNGTLARMPLVGGSPREMIENVKHATWSPDGSQLAIIREVGEQDRLEYPIGNVLYETSGMLTDPRFSPDGTHIAFFDHPKKGDDKGAVSVVDLKGKKNVLSDGYWSERGLAWSSDGKEVMFSASLSGGDFVIFAVTLAGVRRIAEQVPGGLILQAVAPDANGGRWLANRLDYRYAAMVHTPGVPPNTTEDVDLSWLRTSKPKALSQDGRRVLFTEDGLGKNYGVCLRKTDGSPIVLLGDGVAQDLSPDGKNALATLLTKPPQLVIYPTGAGEVRKLDRGKLEAIFFAQWFRDGHRILINGNEPGKPTRFYEQDINSGEMRAVTPEGVRNGRLAPDGKLLVTRGADRKYLLYPLEGGEPRPAPWLTAEDNVVQWSGDGRAWFVYRGRDIPCRVERVDVATGRREFFKAMAPPSRVGIISLVPIFISDDQQSYLYSTYQQVSSLFVTE